MAHLIISAPIWNYVYDRAIGNAVGRHGEASLGSVPERRIAPKIEATPEFPTNVSPAIKAVVMVLVEVIMVAPSICPGLFARSLAPGDGKIMERSSLDRCAIHDI